MKSRIRNDRGASLPEYVLMLNLVCVGLCGTLGALSQNMATTFDAAGRAISGEYSSPLRSGSPGDDSSDNGSSPDVMAHGGGTGSTHPDGAKDGGGHINEGRRDNPDDGGIGSGIDVTIDG